MFAPILDALLRQGDHYLHLADLESYSEAHARLGELYADQEEWSRKAVLNIAASEQILQRPDHRGVREGHLARRPVPGGMRHAGST